MNKGLDIEVIRDKYQKMSDDEFIQLATEDEIGLTIEAQQVLKEEVGRRGLDQSILRSVEVQNKELSSAEFDEYVELIRSLDCPSCGISSQKLNGTMTGEVISFILFTQYERKLRVACPNCLDKANTNALIKSSLFGWWGIPWGFIRTIQAIIINMKGRSTTHQLSANHFLRSYVASKIGVIENFKSDKQKLNRLISEV